ncbi:hypothetical protein A1OE_515 [Candidatus Endolissoclinum faulkneri L2]|uniref:Uncharacterized protein n=1 Tax=Candidatus Endolissoclinum faulkneri L2 TaxID=1193729 RepID=K7Z3X7_9PROT|nr:hypothetical protein A1OE_515 [Candidatus Endolissoclinum faulkneri L2]
MLKNDNNLYNRYKLPKLQIKLLITQLASAQANIQRASF